jgi:hypothetical protein
LVVALLVISAAGFFGYQKYQEYEQQTELSRADQLFFSGSPVKYRQAIAIYEPYAKQGSAHANAALGRFYVYGMGVRLDEKKASEYFARARKEILLLAGKGDPVYQDLAGEILLNHDKDEKGAFAWFQLAAKQGYHAAQYNLAIAYETGGVVKADPEQAAYWYRLAAEQGDADAMEALGGLYRDGRGVMKNVEKALTWYRKSAEKQNSYAEYSIGEMYANGTGVSKDYRKAFEWYSRSAKRGNDGAQIALGKLFEKGRGTEKNLMKALELYKEANKAGNEDAPYRIKRVLRKMARESQ